MKYVTIIATDYREEKHHGKVCFCFLAMSVTKVRRRIAEYFAGVFATACCLDARLSKRAIGHLSHRARLDFCLSQQALVSF